jgi:uncharacterized delta-60 repeat protein
MRSRALISSVAGAGLAAAVLAGCTGTPDTTFGTGGIAVLQQRGGADITLLASGKLMVSSFNGMRPIEGTNVVRLNANGTPDSSYGTSGRLVLPSPDVVNVGPDGRVYVIDAQNHLTAYTAAGKPDAAFGSVQLPFTADSSHAIEGFLAAADGDLYVSDCLTDLTGCQLVRYHSSGQRDNGFVYGGSDHYVRPRVVDSAGNVYVATQAGCSGNVHGNGVDCSIERLTPSGALDASFGASGRLTLPPNVLLLFGGAVAVDSKHFLTMVVNFSQANAHPAVAPYVLRYTAAGKPDLNFGWNGIAGMPGSEGTSAGSLAIDALGRTVATNNPGGFPAPLRVYRYTTTGAADKTFGIYGMAAVSAIRGQEILAYLNGGVVTDSANRILVGTAVPPVWHDTDGTAAVFRLTS